MRGPVYWLPGQYTLPSSAFGCICACSQVDILTANSPQILPQLAAAAAAGFATDAAIYLSHHAMLLVGLHLFTAVSTAALLKLFVPPASRVTG